MDFELRSAAAKFEKEQEERKRAARRRREKELKVQRESELNRAAIEEAHRVARLEEASRAERERLAEEAELESGGGIRFSHLLRPVPIRGSGDKITLPPSALGELSSQEALEKGPMSFELSLEAPRPAAGRPADEEEKTTHGGVLEFTAPEGCVGLPPLVMRNLGGDLPPSGGGGGVGTLSGAPGPQPPAAVRVRYVRLPKGTYVKLQPAAGAADFADVADHRAVLEAELRRHATLTAGDALLVRHAGEEYELRVAEARPAAAVSVIETDLEVDVVPPESREGGAGAEGAPAPLEVGTPAQGAVAQGQYRYYRLKLAEADAAAVAAGRSDLVITLEVAGGASPGGGGGDADLYVSAAPNIRPTQHQHEWSSHDAGTKVVCISPPPPPPPPPARGGSDALRPESPRPPGRAFGVGVRGYWGVAEFKLSAELRPREAAARAGGEGRRLGTTVPSVEEGGGSGGGATPTTQAATPPEGFSRCDNCRQLVPARSVGLHEAYCRRHNVPCHWPGCGAVLRREEAEGPGGHAHCQRCGAAMRRDELAKHEAVFHEPLTCACGVRLEMKEMVKHKAATCPLRTVTCRYCGDAVPVGGAAADPRDRVRGLTQHESECGSRTAPCDTCHRAVMLKDMDLHRAAAHGPPAAARPTPPAGAASAGAAPSSATGPLAGGAGRQAEALAGTARHPALQCPMCSEAFGGRDADVSLNAHLDGHFAEGGGGAAMDVDGMAPASSPEARSAARPVSPPGPLPKSAEVGSHIEASRFTGRGAEPEMRFKQSRGVECPICGASVHSERDLSTHLDMIH